MALPLVAPSLMQNPHNLSNRAQAKTKGTATRLGHQESTQRAAMEPIDTRMLDS
jgi:hypothetical protein